MAAQTRESGAIPLSLKKALVAGAVAGVALVIGAFALLLGVGTVIVWRDGELQVACALPLGVLFLFVGICFLLYGVIVGPSVLMGLWRRDHLLLGRESLLCRTRDGRILTRVPYDNIESITLVEVPDDDGGEPYRMVGITVIDPDSPDTILLEKSPLIGEDGHDVLIRDFYSVEPKKLYKKLLKKWKPHRE